jgi:amidophosphoribosyltransferase
MPSAAIIDQLKEKCAVFGIIGPKNSEQTGLEAARLTFYGLWALQHRGQESSGIASSDGKQLYRHAANGLVATVYREEDLEQLPGHIAIGHNRYSTSGGADECYNQPFIDHARGFAFAHNGNLPDTTEIEAFLTERDISLDKKNDSAMMAAAIGWYMKQGHSLVEAIKPGYAGGFPRAARHPAAQSGQDGWYVRLCFRNLRF